MKTVWITLNLLGLALILFAAFARLERPYTSMFLALGAISMASSNVFKYYAYKKGKHHHPKIVS